MQPAKWNRCWSVLCCKAEPEPRLVAWCWLPAAGREGYRPVEHWAYFHLCCSKNHRPHLACKGGICSTKTENVQCGRVGVGLDTAIFTVNALHWCRSFIQLHLQLIWLTFEGLWPLQQRTPLSTRQSQGPSWDRDSWLCSLCCAQLSLNRRGMA